MAILNLALEVLLVVIVILAGLASCDVGITDNGKKVKSNEIILVIGD